MGKYTRDEFKKAIKAAGYKTQQELADKMGISKSDLSNRIAYGSGDFVRELEVNYNVDFGVVVKSDTELLLERIDRLEDEVNKIKKENDYWKAFSAASLQELEKAGIQNQKLRDQFYTLLRGSEKDFGVNDN